MFYDSGSPNRLFVSFSSHALSDAGANPAWGGKNNGHGDGGIGLWSSCNVGWLLKHCGIDAVLSSGWMSADKRVKASVVQLWELLKGSIMAALLVSQLLERLDWDQEFQRLLIFFFPSPVSCALDVLFFCHDQASVATQCCWQQY